MRHTRKPVFRKRIPHQHSPLIAVLLAYAIVILVGTLWESPFVTLGVILGANSLVSIGALCHIFKAK